ncbi:MAG: hypothetical protein J7L34_05665 [Thermotogaceae bacterium]|nr:hypothetical protein [Thermotogaceae bacterium]
MRRFLVFLFVLSLASVFLATSLGVFGGKEIGGRERFYLGAIFKTDDLIGIGLDAIYPVESFSSAANELSGANSLELDPYLYLNLDLGLKVYAGVGAIVLIDLNTFNFTLYSTEVLRGKVGASIKLGSLSVFAEGIAAFTYSPFATTGIYGAQAGICLNF